MDGTRFFYRKGEGSGCNETSDEAAAFIKTASIKIDFKHLALGVAFF